jgi:hypothetical protein
MADISKCSGERCPLRDTCYRYLAKANHDYQTYLALSHDANKKYCGFYWQVKQ